MSFIIMYQSQGPMAVPFEENGQAGQGEGRCSGGETHHSASGSVLQSEIHEEIINLYVV